MHEKDNDYITDKLQILSLLKRILQSRQNISLSIVGHSSHYLTSLLGIEYQKNQLIFDEPNLNHENKIEKNNEIALSLKLEQLPINFRCHIEEIDSSEKFIRIITCFPDSINYPQRRSHFRLRTEFISQIKASIVLSSQIKIECQLIDISISGLCIKLPLAFANFFAVNQIIHDLYIELPDGNNLSLTTLIHSITIEDKHESVSLRMSIEDAPLRVEQIIQRFIYKTEREQINK